MLPYSLCLEPQIYISLILKFQQIPHNYVVSRFDISEMILTLLKKPNVDINLKYKYVNIIGNNLINYIKTVPYRDYTSYFDDVSADVYKYLLPFYDDFGQKTSLLNSLILRRQPITYIHSIMVKNITILIAKELLRDNRSIFKNLIDLGYKKDEDILYYLTNAALYHDIGKCLTVGVINLQNRKLSEDEFNYIKLHPSKSKLLIGDDVDFLKYYDVMIGHHKNYDGKDGYPNEFDNTKSKYKIAIDLITFNELSLDPSLTSIISISCNLDNNTESIHLGK